ncbi:MAG: hypothetical protein KDB14_00715 [Planctomycetales bacterium]|nr:hypothetical protein [Planctomycetales bacterium]
MWKRMRRPWAWTLGMVTVALLGLQCSAAWLHPTVRDSVEQPIYAICAPDQVQALDTGRDVILWGRLPLGLYQGGRVFGTSRDALMHLQQRGMLAQGYAVCRMSGDFSKDTYQVGSQSFMSHTLQVSERIGPASLANRPFEIR